jgi:hypothetical protein
MLYYLSFEFLLKRGPNGGGVILARSVAISIQTYALTLLVREWLLPNTILGFSLPALKEALLETLPWYGAIFAGAYAALYSRFSAQWTYLADLYNQIMAAQCAGPSDVEAITLWKAGFIEDADDLHLATKPIFASVIASMLKDEAVRQAFIAHAPGREARLNELEACVDAELKKTDERYNPRSNGG